MGLVVEAQCGCGFASESFFLGGGMMDFQWRAVVPALCTRCRRIGANNILSKRPRCSACRGPVTFYTEKALQSPDTGGALPVFEWRADGRDLVLPDVGYRCPACEKLALRFRSTGLWD